MILKSKESVLRLKKEIENFRKTGFINNINYSYQEMKDFVEWVDGPYKEEELYELPD